MTSLGWSGQTSRGCRWFISTEPSTAPPRWSTGSWWTGSAPPGWTPPSSSSTPPWSTPAICRAIWVGYSLNYVWQKFMMLIRNNMIPLWEQTILNTSTNHDTSTTNNEYNIIFSGNFQNRNLGPYALDQISTIYFVPDHETLSLDPSLSLIPECSEEEVSLDQEVPGLRCSTPLSDHGDHHHLQPPENPVLGDFLQPEKISWKTNENDPNCWTNFFLSLDVILLLLWICKPTTMLLKLWWRAVWWCLEFEKGVQIL